MTAWNIDPGLWRMTSGGDASGDDLADAPQAATIALEKSA